MTIRFGAAGGMLFLEPGQLPAFDPLANVGPGKFVELRGVVRRFLGPTPPNILVPRCDDDVLVPKSALTPADDKCLAEAQDATCFKEGESCSVAVRCGARDGTLTTTCTRIDATVLKYKTTVAGCEASRAFVRPRVGEDIEGTH